MMTEEDWEDFNNLLEKIIDLPLPSVADKAQEVFNNVDEALIDEFLAWPWDECEAKHKSEEE